MESILIPTDFSDVAKNATDYAIEIANLTKAKIFLLHVFQIPVIATEVPVIMPSYDELEKDNMRILKSYERELIDKYGKQLSIESIVRPGFITDEINDIAIEKNIDLIVMGLTGGSKFDEILIGSNATGVIKNVNYPTLIVPKNAKFNKIKTLAFACDFEEISKESLALKKLNLFIKIFDAKLLIFNVLEPQEELSLTATAGEERISTIFQNIDHSVYFPENEDLVLAVNDFVKKHNVDILVMLPKKHGFLTRMFKESKTKKMAFHTSVPLLALHD